jgi:hypothetical protein
MNASNHDRIEISSPEVAFTQVVCSVGVPLLFGIFLASGLAGALLWRTAVVMVLIHFSIVFLTYSLNIETVIDDKMISRTRR